MKLPWLLNGYLVSVAQTTLSRSHFTAKQSTIRPTLRLHLHRLHANADTHTRRCIFQTLTRCAFDTEFGTHTANAIQIQCISIFVDGTRQVRNWSFAGVRVDCGCASPLYRYDRKWDIIAHFSCEMRTQKYFPMHLKCVFVSFVRRIQSNGNFHGKMFVAVVLICILFVTAAFIADVLGVVFCRSQSIISTQICLPHIQFAMRTTYVANAGAKYRIEYK